MVPITKERIAFDDVPHIHRRFPNTSTRGTEEYQRQLDVMKSELCEMKKKSEIELSAMKELMRKELNTVKEQLANVETKLSQVMEDNEKLKKQIYSTQTLSPSLSENSVYSLTDEPTLEENEQQKEQHSTKTHSPSFHQASLDPTRLLQYQTYTGIGTPIPPITFKYQMEYRLRSMGGETWTSPQFYTHNNGYKMSLDVICRGYKGNHISVYIHLKRGEFDDELTWPFRGEIVVRLLNQKLEGKYYEETKIFDESTSDEVAGRVTRGNLAEKGAGLETFVSHGEVELGGYLEDKNLILQIYKVSAFHCTL